MARIASAVALVCLSAAAAADPFYLQLDGRYYVVDSNATIEYFPALKVVIAPSLQATSCSRPGGGPMVPSTFYLVTLAGQIPLSTAGDEDSKFKYFAAQPRYVRVKSTTGDLVCAGEVPAPQLPDVIFQERFE